MQIATLDEAVQMSIVVNGRELLIQRLVRKVVTYAMYIQK